MKISTQLAFCLLLISCFSLSSYAQSEDRIALEKAIWGKTEAQFNVTKVPEKWKGESAVILFQDIKNACTTPRKDSYKLTSETTFHTRILLQDKNAVKEYSEFSFTENSNGVVKYKRGRPNPGVTVGFKVIKPSGKVEKIDLKEAVEVQSDDETSAKKIAIPNLQVGDIIDFFYHEVINEYGSLGHFFTPVITTLTGEYPAVYTRFRFEMGEHFYLSYLPLNGVPDIKKTEGDKLDVYEVEIQDLEKSDYPDMMYPYRSLPTVKYQVCYAQNTSNPYRKYYEDQANQVKTGLSDEELALYASELYLYVYQNKYSFIKHLEAVGKNAEKMTETEIIKEAYLWKHFNSVEKKLELHYIDERSDPLPTNNREFANIMMGFLKELDAAGDLILTNRRDYGSRDELLFSAETEYLLRFRLKSGDYIYLSKFELHPTINQVPSQYEGQRAVAYPFKTDDKKVKIHVGNSKTVKALQSMSKNITLPKSSYTDNKFTLTSEVDISDDMSTLIFKNNNQLTGHSKIWYQNRLLGFYDYWDTDRKYFVRESIVERASKKRKEKYQQLVNEYKKNSTEQVFEGIKSIMSDDYGEGELEINDFNILKTGRLGEDDTMFEYEVSGKTDNLIQQAGSNYLLNAGMLIGEQREIKEKDKERSLDIYMSYARSFYNNVSVKIPEGYTVEGIEKLNMNVQNETGAFISSAKMEGSNLIIKTEKWYADNYEPAEEWSEMLAFLEAAYEFTTVKVLLKKN